MGKYLKPEILELFRRRIIKRCLTLSVYQQFFFRTLIKELKWEKLADSELNHMMLPAMPRISKYMLLMLYWF